MLRDLENPGAVRALMLVVVMVIAAIVVVAEHPSVINSDLKMAIQNLRY